MAIWACICLHAGLTLAAGATLSRVVLFSGYSPPISPPAFSGLASRANSRWCVCFCETARSRVSLVLLNAEVVQLVNMSCCCAPQSS
jgi:hypothetical protein